MNYVDHFKNLVEMQLERVKAIKNEAKPVDYKKLNKIVVGFCGGDGIGPLIMNEARKVLEFMLADELEKGKLEFKTIEGLTIENRAKLKQTLPSDVLSQIKSCHVFLKGPTLTPRKGDEVQLESANVALRRELDLFANVRPVKVEELNIDWVFFRENTEGSYTLGSHGININSDLAIDFTVTTKPATQRIAKMAFEFAKATGRKKLTVVTKANIVKTTDGNFLSDCMEVAKNYPEIEVNDIYIDIATAKLLDEHERSKFSVFVLPNLYGDIITDEAAQIQGGVGTAGSANLGTNYAMFEAVHGCAPQMFVEKRQQFADPSSILKAAAMMLNHVGLQQHALKLNRALDLCTGVNSKLKITGYENGATTSEFGSYVLDTLKSL